jgi:hypothetical protein
MPQKIDYSHLSRSEIIYRLHYLRRKCEEDDELNRLVGLPIVETIRELLRVAAAELEKGTNGHA